MFYIFRTSEIILKGKNRKKFERILINNLKDKIGNDLLGLKNYGGAFLLETKNEVGDKIKKIFGIENFSPVQVFNSLEEVKNFLSQLSFKNNFNVYVQRGNKDYPLTSPQIANELKKFIQGKLNVKIEKENPKIKIFLYYRDNKFFLYFEKIKCFGGLPIGSSGKGLILLSAGFDSPVASFLSMKRGLKVYFLHFHSYPQTKKETIEKVKKIVEILNKYNLGSELYLMNILEIQKFYFFNVPKEDLVIFYRKTMFRLGEKLKNELNLDVLITGENLGQVASQTVYNLKVIEDSVKSLILRPLLCFNKQEIIDLARIIGTEKISKEPYDDCCSLFLPQKATTKAKLEKILEIENKFHREIKDLEEKIYSQKECINFCPESEQSTVQDTM
jgi:thiamine biosynthesis protein ThiI